MVNKIHLRKCMKDYLNYRNDYQKIHSATCTQSYENVLFDMEGMNNTMEILRTAAILNADNVKDYAPAAYFCYHYNPETLSEDPKKYVSDLKKELSQSGIPCDKAKFEPHITLIRKASGNWKQVPAPKGEMMVKKISLMKAASKDGKPVYTEEFSF